MTSTSKVPVLQGTPTKLIPHTYFIYMTITWMCLTVPLDVVGGYQIQFH